MLSGTHLLRPQSRYAVYSVAADSRNFGDVAGMSRYPLKRPCRTCFPTPLSQFCSVFSGGRTTEVRLEGGGVALEVPEMLRENFLAKTDRATRGCRSYTHTNRATLCH